jgi:hypothetical protein
MLVRINHRELTTESKSTKLSIIRFLSTTVSKVNHGNSRWATDLIAFLEKHLVVLAQSHTEDNRGHIFEAMDPFLALAPLPADIKHATQSQKLSKWRCDASHCMLSWPIVNRVS